MQQLGQYYILPGNVQYFESTSAAPVSFKFHWSKISKERDTGVGEWGDRDSKGVIEREEGVGESRESGKGGVGVGVAMS